MLESVITGIKSVFAAIPFTSATWFVVIIVGFLVSLFVRANRDPNSPIQWEHLIIDSTNDRVSPYKVGYLIGLVVGTWIIINFADKSKLTYDIFGLYLTYLLGGAGMNSFTKSRDNGYNNYGGYGGSYRGNDDDGLRQSRFGSNNCPDPGGVNQIPTQGVKISASGKIVD